MGRLIQEVLDVIFHAVLYSRRDEHHIYHVIEVVKSLFEEIPEKIKPSNREAYRLYMNNREEFKR